MWHKESQGQASFIVAAPHFPSLPRTHHTHLSSIWGCSHEFLLKLGLMGGTGSVSPNYAQGFSTVTVCNGSRHQLLEMLWLWGMSGLLRAAISLLGESFPEKKNERNEESFRQGSYNIINTLLCLSVGRERQGPHHLVGTKEEFSGYRRDCTWVMSLA